MAHDALVRRVEGGAARFAGLATLLAWLARGGQPDWAAGVVGGWALVAGSAWLIRTSVESAVMRGSSGGKPAYLRVGLRVTVRYALLAVVAYVMIGRLRLSPVGLMIGASSIVVSASIEAIRTLVSSRQI